MSPSVVVVGGGIVGISCAWYLRREGFEVTVIERESSASGCSYGNAGFIVPSHFVPIAEPGVIAKGIRWMWSAKSPFSIRPRLDLDFLRWVFRFAKACSDAHVRASIRPLYELNELSRTLYAELSQSGVDIDRAQTGLAVLCLTDRTLEHETELVGTANELGIQATILNREDLVRLAGVEFAGVGAAYFPTDERLDPEATMREFGAASEAAGIRFLRGTGVIGFERSGNRITEVVTDSSATVACDEVVLSAGSWTPELAMRLGIRILIQPGKGYGVTIEGPPVMPAVPMILSEAKVALTPYTGRIRVVGTMEIGRRTDRVRRSRVDGIFGSIPRYLPGLSFKAPQDDQIWHGFRPVSVDGLPIIGRHRAYENLAIAAGHAMMGMSSGPATGLLVSEVITGKTPSIDLTAFAVDR